MRRAVFCHHRSCATVICVDCLQHYLTVCCENQKIPTCPNPSCGYYYLYEDCHSWPLLKNLYLNCCAAKLISKHGEAARKMVEIKNNVEILRQLRQRFIEQRFPQGIAFTANLIMPQRLRKLDKQIYQKIAEDTGRSRRICMNLTCQGSLNQDLLCLTCGSQFCQACEKLLTTNHLCQPDDVASLQAIKEIQRCPQCSLPIFRSEGCSYMTCAHCRFKFNYLTGQPSDHGSHNQPLTDLKEKYLLSVEYREFFEAHQMTPVILHIESLKPSNITSNTLVTLLAKHLPETSTELPEHVKVELAKAFQRQIKRQLQHQAYQQALAEIEQLILAQTLTVDQLEAIARALQA